MTAAEVLFIISQLRPFWPFRRRWKVAQAIIPRAAKLPFSDAQEYVVICVGVAE